MIIKIVSAMLVILLPEILVAAPLDLQVVTSAPNDQGGETYSISIQILALMTMLTLLPAMLLLTTSFTRIVIVLGIMRQAIGTAQTPTNQVLVGMGLFLTMFIMAPVFEKIYDNAIVPYMEEQIDHKVAIDEALAPMKDFMLAQTREEDLILFIELSGKKQLNSRDEVPITVLIPAFITSELKTAFQMGFMIFIPFLVIDMVVSSVLMAMGMMMLSPMIVSVPFKIMLFVLVDGWTLVIGTLASSFYI